MSEKIQPVMFPPEKRKWKKEIKREMKRKALLNPPKKWALHQELKDTPFVAGVAYIEATEADSVADLVTNYPEGAGKRKLNHVHYSLNRQGRELPKYIRIYFPHALSTGKDGSVLVGYVERGERGVFRGEAKLTTLLRKGDDRVAVHGRPHTLPA